MSEIPEGMPMPKTYKEWAIAKLCGLNFEMPKKKIALPFPPIDGTTAKIVSPGVLVFDNGSTVNLSEDTVAKIEYGDILLSVDGTRVVVIRDPNLISQAPDGAFYIYWAQPK